MRQNTLILLLLVFSFTVACTTTTPDRRIKIIIDADTANEVDDLFALVGAMASDSFDIKGNHLRSVSYLKIRIDSTVRESQKLNEDLARLAGRTDIPLPLGANGPITAMDQPNVSPASNFIVEQAKQSGGR